MLFSKKTDSNRITSFTIEFEQNELKLFDGLPGFEVLNREEGWWPDRDPPIYTSKDCLIQIPDALRLLARMSELVEAAEIKAEELLKSGQHEEFLELGISPARPMR